MKDASIEGQYEEKANEVARSFVISYPELSVSKVGEVDGIAKRNKSITQA